MNLFEEYITTVRTEVDSKLEGLLPTLEISPARLHEAMRYSVFAGGKRFRPALCMASCEAVGGNREDALIPASAIELLHTYTLIHDDLPAMDDDDMRRGKPSSHKAFDEGTAILAGDALLTLSFELLGTTKNPDLVVELARATGSIGTVGGQQDDLDSKEKTISKDEVLAIHKRKTAALFEVSCRMGGVVAEVSQSNINALGEFGQHLGMAFQLLDDLVDDDDVTMKAFEKDEVLALAQEYEKLSFKALEKIEGDSSVLHDLATYTYQSFAV